MTWGWKIKNNDVPSPAYRLEKFHKNFIHHKNKSFDILIIYPIIRSRNIKHVKQESTIFFNNINRKKFPIICARPRPMAKFNRRSILKFIAKDVSTIDSGFSKISDLISNSRLVIIFTHPSTTLLECLYVDQPTVAILDNDNTPTEIVKPHYDFLIKMGLLHNSMDSLVKHLNVIDIELWWNDLLIHPKYLEFKYEFLRKV
jgi:putative transferase (TIGR04331 family)